MYSRVWSGTVLGIQGVMIQVEADVSDGLPYFRLVGYLSKEIGESGERIRTAIENMGYVIPPKRILVNLSPADIRKAGSGYDLAIAVAVLICLGYIEQEDVEGLCFLGELSLRGEIMPVNGVLSVVDYAKEAGYKGVILSKENLLEAGLVQGIEIYGVKDLAELVNGIKERRECFATPVRIYEGQEDISCEDMENIRGQFLAKRGLEIAASGMHNVLMSGPPGAGKTLLAKALAGILPQLSIDEQMELTKLYSVKGMLIGKQGLMKHRPVRAPHHTISSTALVGGGTYPRPGEISLAHHGILFLDELPEFSRASIEVLRQPLEEGIVRIDRLQRNYDFPANVMLVGAMNPCPCGCYPDMSRCTCTLRQIHAYQGKLSRALLDRIDVHLHLQTISFDEMNAPKDGEASHVIRKRVEEAHERQKERYKHMGIQFNSELNQEGIQRYCQLDEEGLCYMRSVFEGNQLSARGYHRMLKVARTIADLDGEERIQLRHLQEAVAFRIVETG